MRDAQYKIIVDAARARGAKFPTQADWLAFKAAIDAAVALPVVVTPPVLQTGRRVSVKGINLIHSFESCRLDTYPDPGSKDGKPVTGGWGSTLDHDGKPFKLGFSAPQAYWDDLFAAQIGKYALAVDQALGDSPTTQHQFDAMVSLCYNIGIAAFKKSTVLRKHKAGDYHGAAVAFGMWVKNDGKTLRGLVRRRAAEADLYDDV